MTSKITAILLACICCFYITQAQIPSYVPTNGLVGWWPFNGNANDESGNGNHGTVNGATLTADRFGNAGKSYSFTSSLHSNINLGNNPNVYLTLNKPLSISLWYKTSNENSGAIISKYENNNPGQSTLFIGEPYNGTLQIGGNGTSPFPTCSSGIGLWKNLTAVFSGGDANIFLNGILNCTVTFPVNSTISNLPLLVGATTCPNINSICNYFSGYVDDIAIYNRALTQQEVTALYTGVPTCIANITNNDTAICKGSSVTLSAATATGNTYTWSTGATTSSITASPTATTKYYCTVSNGTITCKDSVTVTVSTIATNIITADTVKVCGTSTTITAIAGLSSYSWSNGATTQATTVTSSGWYRCTATNGACTARDSVYVSLFNPKIVQNDTTVCAGSSLDLKLQNPVDTFIPNFIYKGALNGKQYFLSQQDETWQQAKIVCENQGGYLACINNLTENLFVTSMFPNSFWIGLYQDHTDPSYSEPYGGWKWVSNEPLSYSSWGSGEPNQNAGQPEDFALTNHNGIAYKWFDVPSDLVYVVKARFVLEKQSNNNLSYLWSTGATTPSITVTPTATTSYIATISNGINTCKDTVKVTVSPITTNIITADTVKVCGTSTSISAVSGFSSYSWSNGANTASTTVTNSGWYKCTVTNSLGCTKADSIYVSLFNPKIVQNDTTVCAGASLTLSVNASNSTSVTDIDGNVYPIVNIGSQSWIQKNLNVSRYRNGDVIPQVTNASQWANLTTGAWCWYVNDSASYGVTYGKLYNWYAVNDPRGLAPQGFHVPTDAEWSNLTNHLGGESIAGGAMKSTTGWSTNNGTTNSSGFTGLPGSFRYLNGTFNSVGGLLGYWWSSSDYIINGNAWNRALSYNNIIVARGNDAKTYGFSVRVVLDASSYLWSTGATTPSITVSPTATTSYIVTVSNGIQSCKDTVKINIQANPAAPAAIQKQFVPTSIAAVTNVSGLVSETYRIKKVANAVSYNWSLKRGTLASITHLNALGANDTAVTVTFNPCFLRDTLCVQSVGVCSTSVAKTAILYANTTPAAISGITTPGGNFAACIGTTKIFTAYPATPTTTQTTIGRYRWTLPVTVSLVSANTDSSTITVQINTGFVGGSISVRGVNVCTGTLGTALSTALQYLPPTPLGISSSTGSYNACINNTITYTAMVAAPTASQTTASVFRWTKPANTTITSASSDSSSITLRFNTGFTGGALSVRGQTICGTLGGTKSVVLTSTGCKPELVTRVGNNRTNNILDAQLYPNPSAGSFNLKITTTKTSPIIVKVMNTNGQLMKSFIAKANVVSNIGNELRPGVYMVEVLAGEERKVIKVVKE